LQRIYRKYEDNSRIDLDLGCFFYLGQSSKIVVSHGFRSKK
jgi:uncharacterized protein involved in tellurium resistance